ncbi:MAG: Gfo/Idh/MocA family protein [Planctomycetota bacterium]|jgi:predicted dehydrogenase
MAKQVTKVGVVGCGAISGIYLKNCQQVFRNVQVAACADVVHERAVAQAEAYGVPAACSVDELLADGDIEIVLNLTVPNAHASIAQAALAAGKHVHNEKPLTITRDEGMSLLAAAEAKGLRVGCAPDTFLGAGHQTCRKLIDDGAIGEPVAATAFMACHGHETWHPDPEFYYKAGGGPMFDMGPYYVTALVHLLGPVRRVTGSARISFPERLITSEPKSGTKITVDVPTHVAGVLDFANGAVATIITSFDVWAHSLPRIEVYGTEGSLSVPDPNGFGGPVRIRKGGDDDWADVPHTHGYAGRHRGIGVADMACALGSGRAHRTNGQLAYHVLDIMHAVHDASHKGRHVRLKSTCDRPAPLPQGLEEGELDE